MGLRAALLNPSWNASRTLLLRDIVEANAFECVYGKHRLAARVKSQCFILPKQVCYQLTKWWKHRLAWVKPRPNHEPIREHAAPDCSTLTQKKNANKNNDHHLLADEYSSSSLYLGGLFDNIMPFQFNFSANKNANNKRDGDVLCHCAYIA